METPVKVDVGLWRWFALDIGNFPDGDGSLPWLAVALDRSGRPLRGLLSYMYQLVREKLKAGAGTGVVTSFGEDDILPERERLCAQRTGVAISGWAGVDAYSADVDPEAGGSRSRVAPESGSPTPKPAIGCRAGGPEVPRGSQDRPGQLSGVHLWNQWAGWHPIEGAASELVGLLFVGVRGRTDCDLV